MKELIKVFDGVELKVEMIDEESFYVNVSGISNKYGKKFSEWKNSKGTKEYLSEVEKSLSLKVDLIDETIHNKTLIHNKILVAFARWISPKFSVWCDNTIYDILTGTYKSQIAQLKAEKRLCRVSLDEYGTVRAAAQRSDYSEKEVRMFAKDHELIASEIVRTLVWRVSSTDVGLVRGGTKGTPEFHIPTLIDLLDQYYGKE